MGTSKHTGGGLPHRRCVTMDNDDVERNKSDTPTEYLVTSSIVPQGALRGVTYFTIEELCDKIRSNPELSNIPIGELYRREMPTGFQHQFIMIKSMPIAGLSVWIRVDRAAKGYRNWQLTSTYPANDTVSILLALLVACRHSYLSFCRCAWEGMLSIRK
jgi:hypothetical protein